jgi:hypothetical protein
VLTQWRESEGITDKKYIMNFPSKILDTHGDMLFEFLKDLSKQLIISKKSD